MKLDHLQWVTVPKNVASASHDFGQLCEKPNASYRIGSPSANGQVYKITFNEPELAGITAALKVMAAKQSSLDEINLASELSDLAIITNLPVPIVYSRAHCMDTVVGDSAYEKQIKKLSTEAKIIRKLPTNLQRRRASAILQNNTIEEAFAELEARDLLKHEDVVEIQSATTYETEMLLMELLYGDLQSVMNAENERCLLYQAVCALEEFHDAGYIHGDAHHGNFFVRGIRNHGKVYGEVLVGDFGTSEKQDPEHPHEVVEDYLKFFAALEKTGIECAELGTKYYYRLDHDPESLKEVIQDFKNNMGMIHKSRNMVILDTILEN
jgi:serine/threonine protein kinase